MRPRGLGHLLVRWVRENLWARESLEEKQLQHDVFATWDQFPGSPQVTVERARELHHMPYDEYLRTPEWTQRSLAVRKQAGWRCSACGSQNRLQSHHLTYRRRGYERPSDLLVLCRDCHRLVHQDRAR